ncbi:MAG: hypothetical protein IPJ65_37635 [Archangiaceae bacterium]|nr:hypothetical protein [Archangiaceae bacterium]
MPLTLDGLTVPAPGSPVLREVMNTYWRRLVADFLALPPLEGRLDPALPDALRAALRADPRPVVRALRRPTVAGLLGAVKRAATPDLATVHALELDLLSELAMTHALPSPRQVRVATDVTLRSLAWRHQAAAPAGSELTFAAGSISGTATPQLAYHPLVGQTLFATSDDNPLLPVQGHPERPGNRVDLGGAPLEQWLTALRSALELIEQYLPELYEELRLALELVVPVGHEPERHFSVSYRDSVGAIYLTLHPSRMTLAEALIHELQHNKLNAVLGFDAVLQSSAAAFASPLRPDPRPLLGVLMAAHAFFPVEELYRRLVADRHPLTRGHDFEKRRAEIFRSNRDAASTVLSNARPTALGQTLLDELQRLVAARP